MKTAIAYGLVHHTVRDTLPLLRTLSRLGTISPYHQSGAERCRDILDAACRQFEDGDATDLFDQEYLAMFDALGFVNAALRHTSKECLYLTRAAAALDALNVEEGAM